jgi:SET domain-containing protein
MQEEKIEVRKSKIDNLGVFAKRNIKKGEVILKFEGEIWSRKKVDKLESKNKELFEIFDKYSLQVDKDLFLFSKKIDDIDNFVNHSCNPNSYVYIKSPKEVFLIALRNLKKNEEITFDYSTTMYNDRWTSKCKCKSKICRKVIREFKYLPPKIKNKYYKKNILPKFILEQFFN